MAFAVVCQVGTPAQVPPGLPPEFAALFETHRIVSRFDKNGDGRLDAAERKEARAWLATQPPRGLAGMIAAAGRLGGGPPPDVNAVFGDRRLAQTSPGPRMTPADVKPAGAAPLYDTGVLRTLFFEFENADWEKELADFYNTDVEVPATMTVDGVTYRDVGVHFRGMSSFMMAPEGTKRSLNVSIDWVHDDQRLMGYRTLNLLNVNGDPTFVRPLLYSEIARHYIPTPRANYVRVVINGEYWGVYVNAQQFNTDFVRDFFGTTRGARWKVPGSPFGQGGMGYLGDSADAYKRIYDIRSRDDARSWADLIRLFRVLNETPPERLEAALEALLDVDGALKFLALEVALVNSDGYWTRASDYNIYQDERGRFHVLPHDTNEALAEEGGGPGRGFGPGRPGGPGAGPGREGRGGPGQGGPPPAFAPPPGFPPIEMPATMGMARADLDPLVGLDDRSKPLRSRLLAVPALRERYLGYVRDIAERWLDWPTLERLSRQYRELIAAAVKADTRKLYTYEAFESRLAAGDDSLKSFVEKRRAFLLKSGK
jgi:spore coat protein CotH